MLASKFTPGTGAATGLNGVAVAGNNAPTTAPADFVFNNEYALTDPNIIMKDYILQSSKIRIMSWIHKDDVSDFLYGQYSPWVKEQTSKFINKCGIIHYPYFDTVYCSKKTLDEYKINERL